MKHLITALLISTTCLTHGQGFNLGQQHFRHHQLYESNGWIPTETVNQWKAQTPKEYATICRKTGTMSNTWAYDLPGYNHLVHSLRVPEPNTSYIFPFIKFYNDWGFDSLIWTLNTHQQFKERQNANRWNERMYKALDLLDSADIKLCYIGLDNESYLDPAIIGMSGGAPTFADKMRYVGFFRALFTPDRAFEEFVRNHYRGYLQTIYPIVDSIRKRYPDTPIAISCDHPITMRGRWMLEELKHHRELWDVLDIHLYPNTSNTVTTRQWVRQRLNGFKGIPLVVFEWNYHYDSGRPYMGFHKDMEQILKDEGIIKHMRHTLWYKGSAFSYLEP